MDSYSSYMVYFWDRRNSETPDKRWQIALESSVGASTLGSVDISHEKYEHLRAKILDAQIPGVDDKIFDCIERMQKGWLLPDPDPNKIARGISISDLRKMGFEEVGFNLPT